MPRQTYYPELDGLRGFAIICVLLFHLDVSWAKAGFLGVDVFFVLSGFLITRLIQYHLVNKSFRFSTFYIRRLRRLFPAYSITILATLIVGYLMFPTPRLNELGESSLFSIAHLGNFYWAVTQKSYFDTGVISFRPLLHLWSLSTEEQFYLVWPLILVTLTKLRIQLWGYAIGLFCFVFAGFLINNPNVLSQQQASFYYPHLRFFEFMLGGFVYCLSQHFDRLSIFFKEILFALSLIVLICLISKIPVVLLPFELSFSTELILVCLATSGCIASRSSPFLGSLFRNRAMIAIGVISYSLYLVHWPLITFYQFWVYDGLINTWGERFGLIFVSLLLAVLMFRYIEQPFRFNIGRTNGVRQGFHSNGVFLAGAGLFSISIVLISGFAIKETTQSTRLANPTRNAIDYNLTFRKQFVDACEDKIIKRGNTCSFNFNKDPELDILVLGDSQLVELSSFFMGYARDNKFNVSLYFSVGCAPVFRAQIFHNGKLSRKCDKAKKKRRNMLKQLRPKVVIVTGNWGPLIEVYENHGMKLKTRKRLVLSRDPTSTGRQAFEQAIFETGQILSRDNRQVIFLSPIPLFSAFSYDCFLLPKSFSWVERSEQRCQNIPIEKQLRHIANVQAPIKQAVKQLPRAEVIHLANYFCDFGIKSCRLIDENGAPLFKDLTHLSSEGVTFIKENLNKDLNQFIDTSAL